MIWSELKEGILYYFLLASIILYFVFYPGIWIPFAHHDDLGIFDQEWVQNLIFHESSLGRPFFGIIDSLLVFPFVKSLNNISFIRLEIVIVLAISLSILAYHLHRLGLSRFYAFSLALLIYLLPGAQQRVFHAISLPAVIGILLATLSGTLFSNFDFHERLQSRKNRNILALTITLLTISAYTYIPSTLFFLVITACDLLFSPKEDLKQQTLRFLLSSIFFSFWLVFTIVLYKFVILRVLIKIDQAFGQNYGGGYKIEISRVIFSRIEMFFRDWLPYESKLWWLEWKNSQFVYEILIITALLVPFVRHVFKKDAKSVSPYRVILSLFLLFGTIIFMNSPSFISDSGGAFARIMFTPSAILVLLLFWSFYKAFGISRWFDLAIVLCIVTSWFFAHQRFNESAKITKTEFDLVRTAVKKLSQSPSNFKEIIVISPTPGISYFGKSYFKDEFNSLNSHDHGEVRAMIQIVLKENKNYPINFSVVHIIWDPQYFQSWYDSDFRWFSYGEKADKMTTMRSSICHINEVFLIYKKAVILNFGQSTLYKSNYDACEPNFQRVSRQDFVKTLESLETRKKVRLDFLLIPDNHISKHVKY